MLLVNHQVSPSTLKRHSLQLIANQPYDLVIESRPGPTATRVPCDREYDFRRKECLESAAGHCIDPIRRSIETIADLDRLQGQRCLVRAALLHLGTTRLALLSW